MVDSKDNCCKMMYDAMLEGYALLKIMKNADNEPYDYSIIEINKKFEAIVGVSRNEVIGKTVGQALPESCLCFIFWGSQSRIKMNWKIKLGPDY